MKFLKKIAGILGFAKDESNELKDEQVNDAHRVVLDENQTHHLPRKGFSVPVQVSVDRAQPGPVLLPTNGRDGGVQVIKCFFLFFDFVSTCLILLVLLFNLNLIRADLSSKWNGGTILLLICFTCA